MEERLKQLKDGLDGYLAVDNKFSENQKVKIRNAIAKNRRKNRGRYFQADWMKQALSIAVACSLILAIGTFAYKNLSGSGNQSMSMDKASPMAKSNAASDSSAKMAEVPESKDKSAESAVQKYDYADKTNLDSEVTPINEGILPLSEKMQEIYKQFQANPDQELLKGLEPYQVMQLYYYASTQQDYATQYELYLKDDRYLVPTKEEFLRDVSVDPNLEANKKAFTEDLKTVTNMKQKILEDQHDGYLREAVVIFKPKKSGYELGFRLIRNNDGIWTVAWMPIQ